jgi:hypothetical protein
MSVSVNFIPRHGIMVILISRTAWRGVCDKAGLIMASSRFDLR